MNVIINKWKQNQNHLNILTIYWFKYLRIDFNCSEVFVLRRGSAEEDYTEDAHIKFDSYRYSCHIAHRASCRSRLPITSSAIPTSGKTLMFYSSPATLWNMLIPDYNSSRQRSNQKQLIY